MNVAIEFFFSICISTECRKQVHLLCISIEHFAVGHSVKLQSWLKNITSNMKFLSYTDISSFKFYKYFSHLFGAIPNPHAEYGEEKSSCPIFRRHLKKG